MKSSFGKILQRKGNKGLSNQAFVELQNKGKIL
jgi:hypothetical protein